MNIYHYHPITKEFIESSSARKNPLDPGNFLIPAFSTDIPPIDSDHGFSIIFVGNGWELIADNRGKIVYNQATKEKLEIKDLGEIPDGFVIYDESMDAEEKNIELERVWRNSALMTADHEVNKHIDGDQSAISTIESWKSYRISLRNWPESEYFPDPDFRPVAPS